MDRQSKVQEVELDVVSTKMVLKTWVFDNHLKAVRRENSSELKIDAPRTPMERQRDEEGTSP